MKEFWDERYSEAAYAYGLRPNTFFAERLALLLPGRVLLPGDGEGRNAVHAARAGWDVQAVDFSEAGREKALRLADAHGVGISYALRDLIAEDIADDPLFAPASADVVALVFVHLPEEGRKRLHAACIRALRSGGTLIIEAFSPRQLARSSGGPRDPGLLYTSAQLAADAAGLRIDVLEECDVELDEGPFHQGPASVVRLVAHR